MDYSDLYGTNEFEKCDRCGETHYSSQECRLNICRLWRELEEIKKMLKWLQQNARDNNEISFGQIILDDKTKMGNKDE